MKICKKCNVQKQYDEFYIHDKYLDKHDPMCKSCRLQYSIQYNEKHKERLKQYRKVYYYNKYWQNKIKNTQNE